MKLLQFEKILHIFTLLLITLPSVSQNNLKTPWNSKQCAVALTYDDGLNVHLDNVIPILDSLNIKATFYIPGNSKSLEKRLYEWKAVANNGHELGNHTLFHPCNGNSKDRDWVNADYDLDNYSINKIIEEIELANFLLYTIDNKTKRTFAYTCGDKTIKDSSFVELIKKDFIGARDVYGTFNAINNIDLFSIKAYGINGENAVDLINLVKEAQATNSLIVFLFHGVGGEHNLNISLEEHNKFVRYLKRNEVSIWTTSLVEILEFYTENLENQ